MPRPENSSRDAMVRLLPSAFRRIDQLQARVDKQREPWKVQPGSSLYLDDLASAPLQISHTAQRLFLVAVDHLHAVRVLLAPDLKAPNKIDGHLHINADYTILRGAMEASLTALWLLRPQDRLTRVSRSITIAQQDAFDVAMALPPGEERDLMKASRSELIQEVLDRHDGLSRPGQMKMAQSFTQAVAGTTREGAVMMWRMCSGMAHGRLWASQALSAVTNVQVDSSIYRQRAEGDISNVALMLHEALAILDSAVGVYDGRARAGH